MNANLDDFNVCCRRGVECLPANAGGPQRLGRVSSLLRRLVSPGLDVPRQHGQDLGCKQREMFANARGWSAARWISFSTKRPFLDTGVVCLPLDAPSLPQSLSTIDNTRSTSSQGVGISADGLWMI